MYNFKDYTQHVRLGKALSSTTVESSFLFHHLSTTTIIPLRSVPAHVAPDSCVVEETLNLANGRDGDVSVPELPLGEVHDVLLGDGTDNALNLLGCEPPAGGDDLTSNILGDGGGAIEGKEDAGLELRLGALDLGGGDAVGETRPLAEGEVDEIVNAGDVVGHEVDTPETRSIVSG